MCHWQRTLRNAHLSFILFVITSERIWHLDMFDKYQLIKNWDIMDRRKKSNPTAYFIYSFNNMFCECTY